MTDPRKAPRRRLTKTSFFVDVDGSHWRIRDTAEGFNVERRLRGKRNWVMRRGPFATKRIATARLPTTTTLLRS